MVIAQKGFVKAVIYAYCREHANKETLHMWALQRGVIAQRGMGCYCTHGHCREVILHKKAALHMVEGPLFHKKSNAQGGRCAQGSAMRGVVAMEGEMDGRRNCASHHTSHDTRMRNTFKPGHVTKIWQE